jgi:hypothetical protein
VQQNPASTALGGSSDGRATDDAFELAFGPIAFAVNRHLVEHMVRAQRELGVDYESMVIWGILAHLNVAHLMPPGTDPARVSLDIESALVNPETGFRPLRLRDLAQVTGLPRETIRRKLAKLVQLGYIVSTPSGWIIRPESVDVKLREFTRDTTRRLLACARQVDAMLHAAEPKGDAASVGGRPGGPRPAR